MPTELERKVAGMPCLGCDGCIDPPFTDERGNLCQGTGLQWPGLSRGCKCKGTGTYPECCSMCSGHLCQCGLSGRVPDVTLIKVLDLLPSGWELKESDFGYVITSLGKEYHDSDSTEAACAALLASAAR